ncbi:hypothetical protein CBR_g12364 [Chara braunii]|uniref:Uncharacterized protein n=1 Tax=Chara braunii TaxID=69332 RepID=A0A388KRX7_CHABU|nr:hypothetical protein CBR_g12364 [Chara braunii]|eukprot:GBG72796.1 hypothetical protein CBR_g12364 [Chara braunii]
MVISYSRARCRAVEKQGGSRTTCLNGGAGGGSRDRGGRFLDGAQQAQVCLPSFMPFSPPSRPANPLIHDARFLQREKVDDDEVGIGSRLDDLLLEGGGVGLRCLRPRSCTPAVRVEGFGEGGGGGMFSQSKGSGGSSSSNSSSGKSVGTTESHRPRSLFLGGSGGSSSSGKSVGTTESHRPRSLFLGDLVLRPAIRVAGG